MSRSRGEITLDDLVGRAYSMSSCSPERLAERRTEFERDLRTALAPFATNGAFIEIAEMVALLTPPEEEKRVQGA